MATRNSSEVPRGQQAAVGSVIRDDGSCDIATVKSIARRFQSRRTTFHGRRLLFISHVLEGAAQVGLYEDFTAPRRTPARKIDRRARRPARVVRGMHRDHVRHQPVHGKAGAREADRRRRAIAEAHRSVILQRRDPGVGRGRNHGAQNAFRDPPNVPLLEKIRSHGARPSAQAAYRQHVALVGAIDHDRRHPGDVHQIALQNAQRDARRNAGIHGIAAGLKHGERGMRGAVMSGDGHVASSEQQRAQALDAGNGQGFRDRIAGHL